LVVSNDITDRRRPLEILCAAVFIGGIGRTIAGLVDGPGPRLLTFFIAIEFGGPVGASQERPILNVVIDNHRSHRVGLIAYIPRGTEMNESANLTTFKTYQAAWSDAVDLDTRKHMIERSVAEN
jgi:hypothetical protein